MYLKRKQLNSANVGLHTNLALEAFGCVFFSFKYLGRSNTLTDLLKMPFGKPKTVITTIFLIIY